MSEQSESTETVPELGSDALFSPFPPALENIELGKYYIWSRNGNLEVVRARKHWEFGEGLECMANDFPSRDFWPFEDDLVGCLYGPIHFSENNKDHSPIGAVSASNTESNSAAPIG